ncbi:MAG: alpha-glucan family phosphorylase [Verrucomicrobia subdivision 3 bacterium]|nr:alpha-glucan family phosphorylase [Limisphaerales bacterium]
MTKKPLSASELTELIVGLNRLARNLWWTWSQGAQEIFQELSPRGWQNLYHNAVAVLHEVSDYELRVRLQDPEFADRVRQVLQAFDNYLKERATWCRVKAPSLVDRPVAYFTAEFGFHETLPIAAGGLGMLAGDHAKSASDLGLGFVGISLFYREGYFQQAINHDNWQIDYYTLLNPKNLPIEPVLDARGEPLVCDVEMATGQVYFKAWRVNVGRCPAYLLDTNLPQNEQHYRDLTLRVYGGDSTTRIMQEILLGIGGVRFLRALGVQPSVFHMNEGHAAFLALELIRENQAAGMDFEQALAAAKKQCHFTTHTPVEAGHDRFSPTLMQYALHRYRTHIKCSDEEFMGLGRVDPKDDEESFCMTVLALKASRTANAVSELHGQVSRQMWAALYPDKPVDQVPIGHITNGIHLLGWMKGPVRRFWRRKLSDAPSADRQPLAGETTSFWMRKPAFAWEHEVNSPEFWQRMDDPNFLSDEEIWALRYKLRRELIEFARRRLLIQGQRLSQGDFIAFDQLLNPDALTIGFARRFATYKRAPLIFQQFDNIVRLVQDKERPLQFVFAGKAHPRDDEGKRFIQHIIHLSKYSELKGHLVFIENYDVHVARTMVAGCDVWLNNPRRPLEASGTSGQKAGCHGCLNLSIMDGWWREGYDGTNGFAIGDDTHPASIEEQDKRDSANLYRVLTEEVIPCFFERDATGIPRQWIKKVRRAMVTLVPSYNTWRMVQDYTKKYYLPS